MKAHELLSSPAKWCQESPAEDGCGNKVLTFDPGAVKWCALAAVHKSYPPFKWEEVMNRVLRALSVSEQGICQLSRSEKACCLMEWNDARNASFQEIREVFVKADI